MKIKLFLFLLFCVFALSCGVSESDVRGEVFISAKDGQIYRLETVQVHIYETSKIERLTDDDIELTKPDFVATTDANGKFSVKIPHGDYTAITSASIAAGKQIESYHWKERFTVSGKETELVLDK